MRVVIQRVSKASVSVNNIVTGQIGNGLLVFAGFEDADTIEDVEWISNKILQLRIFNDEQGIMNRSVIEDFGGILVVSQFTLHAKTKKGNRPSYIKAAKPETAIPLYEHLLKFLTQNFCGKIESGVFGAMMEVLLINDGPVTIIIDSKNKE